jgi:outer membrane biosynthesis protein TonB
MGDLKLFLFFAAILVSAQVQIPAQNPTSTTKESPSTQQQVPYEIQIDSKIAETLLIHKEEPACQKDQGGLRIVGTVVLAITIDKNGKVSHAQTLSGPKLLRPLALATVRKYLYKPYLLKKTPVEVETTVSIPIDCFFHNGQA